MAQPANQKEITVGGIRIPFLPDGYGRIDKMAMFPGTTADGWNLHPEWLDENGRVVASIGGFLIRPAGATCWLTPDTEISKSSFPGSVRSWEGAYSRAWRPLVWSRVTSIPSSIPICISTISGGPAAW
jgi:hypothetical protein